MWNPTVIGLFAAALGLIGSVVVAQVNNNNTQNLERYRSQSNLVLEVIKTGNSDAACRNLLFFVKLRLLDDPNKAILGQCDSVPKGAPSLPAAATDVFDGMFKVEGRVLDKADHTPIEGVELTLEVPVYFVNRPELRITTSDSQGRFRFKINAFVATAKLTAAKNGYNPSEESVTIEVGNLLFSSRP